MNGAATDQGDTSPLIAELVSRYSCPRKKTKPFLVWFIQEPYLNSKQHLGAYASMMDREQEKVYNHMMAFIDNDIEITVDSSAQSLADYNLALSVAVRAVQNASRMSLNWARNRMHFIESNLVKSRAQCNAIQTIESKYRASAGKVKTKIQRAEVFGKEPLRSDLNLLRSEETFKRISERTASIEDELQKHATQAPRFFEKAICPNNVDAGRAIGRISHEIREMNPLDRWNDESLMGENGQYHVKHKMLCELFEEYHDSICHLKIIADKTAEAVSELNQLLAEVQTAYRDLNM